jgi:hypothetical protein
LGEKALKTESDAENEASVEAEARRLRADATGAHMTLLRVDPWDPEYGASAVDLLAEEGPQSIEFAIEDRPWRPVALRPLDQLPCCAFVDGVRRIDVRLFAEDESAIAPALGGSWAVGSAWSTRPLSSMTSKSVTTWLLVAGWTMLI